MDQPSHDRLRSGPEAAGNTAPTGPAEPAELFARDLPARLAELRQAAAAGEWRGLRRMAHQLASAADSSGQACLGISARTLASHAEYADHEAVALALADLATLSRRIVAAQPRRDPSDSCARP